MSSMTLSRSARVIATLLIAPAIGLIGTGSATAADKSDHQFNGNNKVDADGNGYPDAGVVVSGNFFDTYSSAADGDCTVRVNYRGTFENDTYQDNGWIQNHYRCVAPDGAVTTYNYLMVHETDPRYVGDPAWALWGTWEYHVLTEGGEGNLVRPAGHIG